jgi:group I intron endonuclease
MESDIYMIINILNGKLYIGITKKKYGDNDFGYKTRFKQHLINAFTKSKCNDCPKLYNAIRKYGKDNFIVILLEECRMDERCDKEKYYINKYNTTNDNYGYNISLGGDGRSVVNINENIRQKISSSQSNVGECNIKPYYRKNIHVGFYVKRRENGRMYQKYYTSTEYTVEENYNKSLEFLESIKNNTINDLNKYNRKDDLPQNITIVYNKSNTKSIGYLVSIKKYQIYKRFTQDELEVSLIKAKEYLKNVLNEVKTTYMNSEKSDADNPQQSS